MKFIKKLLFFFSIFVLYIIAKEFVTLYRFTRSVHPIFGYASLITILLFISYFIILPIVQIIRIPRNYAPTKNKAKIQDVLHVRMNNFRTNPFLQKVNFNFESVSPDEIGYQKIIDVLQPETEKMRKKYVAQLFYSSAIAQNGFLDAILILSSSVNLVKDLFILYHGRVSNKDLLIIAKKVYYSMAIGGSEGVEYAAEEIFSKLTTGGIKSIPFASKILGSIADGFVNAALLNRVSIITENYCRFLHIQSEKDLYPSYRAVVSSTKIITSDIIERLIRELKNVAKDKTSKVVLMTVNPVGYLIGKALGRMAESSDKLTPQQREIVQDSAAIAQNPVGYGFSKVAELFRRKKTAKQYYL
ncbi:MAG: DUF697 domain-containing protein [bacterium]